MLVLYYYVSGLSMVVEVKVLKCPYEDCRYVWETRSKLKMVTCPSCTRKINSKENMLPNELTRMEHFNLDERGVRILDQALKWIVDVHFKPKSAWCNYCERSDCKHVKFALSIPDVQKIIKKKGWKIEE